MTNIVDFPTPDERAGSRLHLMHTNHPPLFDLPEDLGSPDDWLFTAMEHLGLQCTGTGWVGGNINASKAAVSLVLMKLEELLLDGPRISIRPTD